jgi:Rieske Fe-S protein
VEPSEHGPAPDGANNPTPTVAPAVFALGIAVLLVGLIIDPVVISSIGGGIAVVSGYFWARQSTAGLRRSRVAVEPETRAGRAAASPPEHPDSAARFPRNRFLEAATLGLGGVIGGIVTVPIAGFALLPPFLGQKRHEVDLGLLSDFPEGKWFITTFTTDPAEGTVSRRTAFVRNNGLLGALPSFTIISNHCVHLGCPVQANGPTGAILGEKNVVEHTANGVVLLRPVVPAGFGCPCHGGQYDTEGNRTAGPPVRALDRYSFEIKNGHVILLSTFSVSHVDGTGAQAKIFKYKEANPGNHVNGPEQWLYPLQPPHH